MIKPYFETELGKLYHGGGFNILKCMPDESINCVVTSPPYWGLRDYSTAGQIGLESTIQEYIEIIVKIFTEIKRVLTIDGTLWLNMGDSYAGGGRGGNSALHNHEHSSQGICGAVPDGLKPKDLIGMPWRIAFALQTEGWYLRSDIIWHKPNPMPESVTDRPTKSHEYIFLMSKSNKYFYDAEAIKEKVSGSAHERGNGINPKAKYKTPDGWDTQKGSHGKYHREGRERDKKGYVHKPKSKQNESFSSAINRLVGIRNKRTVWTVPTQGYSEAHFATYPINLIYPCIKAGCPEYICKKCGKAKKKIYNTNLPNPNLKISEFANKRERNEKGQFVYMGKEKTIKPLMYKEKWNTEHLQIGYTDCGCNAGFDPGVVLDPFMGSGTTAVVAERLNRKWTGIEINQDYVNIAVDRIKKETAQYKMDLTYIDGGNK